MTPLEHPGNESSVAGGALDDEEESALCDEVGAFWPIGILFFLAPNRGLNIKKYN